MTDIVSRARAALDGTTEGPWKSRDPYDDYGDLEQEVEVFADKPGDRIAYYSIAEVQSRSGGEVDPALLQNARFFAWARTGVPELVAEMERLRAQIGAVESLAAQLGRESSAPGQYRQIRRDHARRILDALDGEATDA